MSGKLEKLKQTLQSVMGTRLLSLADTLGELTIVIGAGDYSGCMMELRDHADLRFETLIDLCGVDYSAYGDGSRRGGRFAIVSHLLSITHNWRLRVRVFAPDDEFPVVASVTEIWPGANWFEREAFDFFGVMFEGHEDLRR